MTASEIEAEAETTPGQVADRVTVLLVDDDETWARVTGRLLERNNDPLELTIANSLAEGRAGFDQLDPDCVVCDYQLGDGTGLALLETVRATDPDRPFLLITGRGSESVASDAIGRGVTDYIRKEQDDDEAQLLASRITNAVSSHRTERALERERRSKTALLDILTGTTAETELSQEACTRLIAECGFACAWLGRETESTEIVPRAVAGQQSYLDAILTAGESLPPEEPARQALDRDESVRTRVGDSQSEGGAADSDWESLASEYGFERVIAAPIRHDGVRFGVLAAYADDTALLDDEEGAIQEYAETIGYALTSAERKRSMLSSRRVSVQVELDADAVPLGVLTSAGDADWTVDLLSTVLRDDGTTLYVVEIECPSRDPVEEVVAAADGVHVLTVDQSATPTRCELIATGPTPEERMAAHGVVVDTTTLTSETVSLLMSVPESERLSTIREVLTAEFGSATVSAMWTGRRADSPTTDRDRESVAALTDRQQEVLRHALNVGYFERPRGATATELAEHFGVTRATVSQHLRTAQRKIFTRLFRGRDSE